MRVISINAFAVIGMLAAIQAAQAQAPAAPVQQAMRQLMMAEEQYYSDHGTYTTDVSVLGLMPKVGRMDPQVWVRVYHAGGAGWIADARGGNGMTGSCVAFVGDLSNFASIPTTEGKRKPTEEGVIVCDP